MILAALSNGIPGADNQRPLVEQTLATMLRTMEALSPAFTQPGLRNAWVVFSGWVLTAGVHAVTQALVVTDVARRSIERTMQTVWRVLLRLTSDRALVSRAPVLFAKAYNRGRLEASFPKPCLAELRLHDWPNPPAWPLRATRIGIETALRLGNRKNVVVRATRATGGAVLIAAWEA